MNVHLLESPVGVLAAELGTGGELFELRFSDDQPTSGCRSGCACTSLRRQLEEYFAGGRREFELALAPRGTEFQRRVWAELARVGYGETVSYGELARRIGKPGAVRAVGRANGDNPIPIIIPCHRVIGADGTLTGYGGGLERKRTLLRLEGSLAGPQLALL